MNAGRIAGAIVLAAIIALIIAFEAKPKPPKAMLPYCWNEVNTLSDWCRNVPRFGKA